MFRYILSGGDMQSWVISILLTLPIVLLSLSLHETAHGYAAYKLGDPTARALGRLTLSPLKHLDPVGFISMLVFGFGWAKPVPINSRYFKKPRRDIALTALAGPASNLLLALVFLLLLRFVGYGVLARVPLSTELIYNLVYFTILFFYYGVYMNITLAVFNLLPLPPLDGSRLLFYFLPPKWYFKIAPYERYITLAVMLLLVLGPLSELIGWLTTLILRGLFALVGMPGFLL